MSYETWTMLNNACIVGVLVVPIVLAALVFFRQRRSRSPEGKVTGRPVAWSLTTLVGSFIALVVAWGLSLQEGFPQHTARRDREYAASEDAEASRTPNSPSVIEGVVGSWRPNNASRTDYFTFTASTYASVNPEFDTVVTYTYRVLRHDGPCMRIQPTGSEVSQGGGVTQRSSRTQAAFIVCVDPETDQMLMRFDSDRGNIFFTRMN